jgi:LDH2 family malate/lactate/ureidoglycolate dehydrogenase
MHTKNPVGMNIGHFFTAIDRGVFRESDDFQTDVATFMRALRATTPVDPARMRDGIRTGPGLLGQVRQIAKAAEWVLDKGAKA